MITPRWRANLVLSTILAAAALAGCVERPDATREPDERDGPSAAGDGLPAGPELDSASARPVDRTPSQTATAQPPDSTPDVPANAAAPPDLAGSVAYWPLDEASGTTARDARGNGHDGAIDGASWTSGARGGALAFDGTADRVVVPGFSYGDAFTVAFWLRGEPRRLFGRSLDGADPRALRHLGRCGVGWKHLALG